MGLLLRIWFLSELVGLSAATAKATCKGRTEFFNSGRQAVIRLITPLRMSYEESYARAYLFEKMVPGIPDPEMIEDTVKL